MTISANAVLEYAQSIYNPDEIQDYMTPDLLAIDLAHSAIAAHYREDQSAAGWGERLTELRAVRDELIARRRASYPQSPPARSEIEDVEAAIRAVTVGIEMILKNHRQELTQSVMLDVKKRELYRLQQRLIALKSG